MGRCSSEVQLRGADGSRGCIVPRDACVSTTLNKGWWPCDWITTWVEGTSFTCKTAQYGSG